MQPQIGIPETSRVASVKALSHCLADTYTLYLKTQMFHWNVTGMSFKALHELFEEQYRDLAEAADEIAERIRTLGAWAPGSYVDFQRLTCIPAVDGKPDGRAMVTELIADHERTTRRLRDALPAAEDGRDEGTVDLLTARLRVHEKAAWMLRAHVTG